MKYLRIFCLLIFLIIQMPSKGQDAGFFNYWTYFTDHENWLYKNHCEEAFRRLDERKKEVSELKTKAEWLDRQQEIKKILSETLSPFPEKTPLNAKIQGTIDKDGYRIEKIIYESLPGYHVTAALYIPEGIRKKAPAVFYACGHSEEGFRVGIYQHIIINLVKKGFVVFTIDPMGQGERFEYWDTDTNHPVFPVPDHQHSFAGAQCLITGYSVASYFILDVMRGIDYMISRPEVDPERIGITGRSGGGNLAAYVGALDDRILACAPECYITSYEYLLKSIGPQCAEQNLYQMVKKGLDHPDFIEARAPKPTLIISTTRDFFSIQGARESYLEAKKMYAALDAAEKLTMVEDDAIHTSTPKNREAMYAFFQKFLDNPGSPEDLEVDIPSAEELRITKTGQIQTSLEGETVYSLNLSQAEKKFENLRRSRANQQKYLAQLPEKVAKISGIQYPDTPGKPWFSGRMNYPGYQIEKYLIPSGDQRMLPVMLLKPEKSPSNRLILLLDSDGKTAAMNRDSLVIRMLNEGYTLLLADLPGIGELGPGYLKGDSYIAGTSYNQWFAAILAGNSHTGLRAGDILTIVQFIKNLQPTYVEISCIAYGSIGIDLLHASLYDSLIGGICLVNPILSYENLISKRYYLPELIPYTVSGSVGFYDLPDLIAFRCPHKTLIIEPIEADGTLASGKAIKENYSFPVKVYQQKGRSSALNFVDLSDGRDAADDILFWLSE